jgi:hypothetical protein
MSSQLGGPLQQVVVAMANIAAKATRTVGRCMMAVMCLGLWQPDRNQEEEEMDEIFSEHQ